MKRIHTVALAVAIIAMLFCICSCSGRNTLFADLNQSDENAFVSYCAVENTDKNQIYFNYPQFCDKSTQADELNRVITDFVKSALQNMCEGEFRGEYIDSSKELKRSNREYSLQALDIGYEIRRCNSEYLSVTFEGTYYLKTAAYPISCFLALTVDRESCKTLALSDLYIANDGFAELVKHSINEQIVDGLAEKLGVSPDEIPESVADRFMLTDNKALLDAVFNEGNADSFCYFMTDDALEISIPLEHAVGDHFEILISFDELKPYEKKT